MGQISVIDVRFEADYGTLWTTCDDCSTQRTLPFSFPFYGSHETVAYVGTNGYITFGSGDNTYTESVSAFSRRKRIAAFFDDLIGGGGVYINDRLPDRYIVTYDRTRHFTYGGSNTLQIQLFRDGRIVFAFKGMTALRTGAITGLTPGSGAPFMQVNYSTTPTFAVPAGTAVYEYFTSTSPFDLDNSFVVFTPAVGGGYNVRTVLPTPVASTTTLSGAAVPTAPQGGPAQLRSGAKRQGGWLTGTALANAEVRVTSSGNPDYLGMTNTDAQGRFTLTGVPAGGINVEIWHNGVLLGRGAGLSNPSQPDGEPLQIGLVSPEAKQKS
jgi:hypothetical protein